MPKSVSVLATSASAAASATTPTTGPGSHKNWPMGYPEPAAVAKLLKTTPNMDKKNIGAFLSKGPDDRYPFNGEVLRAFVKLFDFRGRTFDSSMRMFLEAFRLPGEAQVSVNPKSTSEWKQTEARLRTQ